MTSNQRKLIFVLAGVGLLMVIATTGLMTWWTFRNVLNQKPPTEDEKRLVLTAQAMKQFGFTGYDPDAERFTVLRQFGTRHIQYTYDSRDLESPTQHLFLTCLTEVHPQALNAVQSYQMQKLAMKAGVAVAGGAKMVDSPGLLRTLGAEGYAATLVRDKPVGHVFLIRQGRAIHMITITNILFEHPDEVKQLLGPLLVESRRQLER